MGEDVPIGEPEYGFCLNCLACFPVGETPCFVQLKISDVHRCEDYDGPIPNGRKFILEQRWDINICEWQVNVDDFSARYNAATSGAQLWWGAWDLFLATNNPCFTTFTNESVCLPGTGGTLGSCTVSWGPGINQAAFDAQF